MTYLSSPTDHLMIDIESMSLHPHNALILSIGMCYFDPWAKRPEDVIGKTHIYIPSIPAQMLLGRHVDPGTQEFWRKQSPEAAAHWKEHQPPVDNLHQLTMLMSEVIKPAKFVWANHILFDLGNVNGLFQQVRGESAPWHYRAPTDMPSFCNHTPQTRGLGDETAGEDPLAMYPNLIDHEPVSDCIKQSLHVWERWPNGQ